MRFLIRGSKRHFSGSLPDRIAFGILTIVIWSNLSYPSQASSMDNGSWLPFTGPHGLIVLKQPWLHSAMILLLASESHC